MTVDKAADADHPVAAGAGRATRSGIGARLDRLPRSRHLWRMIILLSLGGAFEYYDLFFTGYVAPGMVKAGMFSPASLGPLSFLVSLGLQGIGTFVFATFAGLFVGAMLLGSAADRFGRRTVFIAALLWYSLANLVLGFQDTGFGVDLWRFISGIGLGIELVTIDTYIAELIPARDRGRAFALSSIITFSAIPLVALLAWLLVPQQPFGLDGWRLVVLIGSAGALAAYFFQRAVPESPRWLARQGRHGEADRIVSAIEAAIIRETGAPLPDPAGLIEDSAGNGRFQEIWSRPYRGRTIMLSVFHFFQAIGFYGFAAWVPSLLIAKGILITKSLEYSFIIAIANPVGPLLGMFVADRFERKWQICAAAFGIAVFGVLFAVALDPVVLIVLGVMVTLSNNWMSFSFHNYQAELFPTRIRARAVGFVYGWSRLSAAFAGLAIDYLLQSNGVVSVFLFIGFAMLMVVVSVAGFGPKTRELALEEIALPR
jgi:MFS transporter, putative metabolite:H+ symporter